LLHNLPSGKAEEVVPPQNNVVESATHKVHMTRSAGLCACTKVVPGQARELGRLGSEATAIVFAFPVDGTRYLLEE
jgi:hypothetical protein